MPRNQIIDLPRTEWRGEPARKLRPPPRPDRWEVAAGMIGWFVLVIFVGLAAIGLKTLVKPPAPKPAIPDLQVGETRELGGGWSITRQH